MDADIRTLMYYLKLFAERTDCHGVNDEIEALCNGLDDTLSNYKERIEELEAQIERLAEGKSVSLY